MPPVRPEPVEGPSADAVYCTARHPSGCNLKEQRDAWSPKQGRISSLRSALTRTGSYVATARTFGIIATGNSMQELRINALEAVDDYFDDSMPQPTLVHFLYAAGDMLME